MEKINIELVTEITTWKPSQSLNISVLINGKEVWQDKEYKINQDIELKDVEVEDGVENTLELVIDGMKSDYTLVGENGVLLKDVMFHVKNVFLDDIDLGSVFQHVCEYYPTFPEGWEPDNEEDRCMPGTVDLGWNGRWVFKFESPVYLWMLENF